MRATPAQQLVRACAGRAHVSAHASELHSRAHDDPVREWLRPKHETGPKVRQTVNNDPDYSRLSRLSNYSAAGTQLVLQETDAAEEKSAAGSRSRPATASLRQDRRPKRLDFGPRIPTACVPFVLLPSQFDSAARSGSTPTAAMGSGELHPRAHRNLRPAERTITAMKDD